MISTSLLEDVRARRVLVHCISNIVTANDCANLLLSIGASPIMAQASEEVAEISAMANALVMNTGTPSAEKFAACRLAGEAANGRGIPVVVDPVGIGASAWRLDNVRALLGRVRPSLLRVNYGEAQALLRGGGGERGVDSLSPTADAAGTAVQAARKYAAVVLLSGADDIVTDGETVLRVSGGSSRMRAVTGAGCMLSALCGAFAAVTPNALEAAACASFFWKCAAGRAGQAAQGRGMGSFRAALFDAASELTVETLSAVRDVQVVRLS